jgi:hypothetical protein
MQIIHSIPPWAIPAVLIANSISLLLYNVSGSALLPTNWCLTDYAELLQMHNVLM